MKRTLLIICTLLCANVLSAQTRFTIGDLTYEVTSGNEVEVHDCAYVTTSVVIPETVTNEGTTYSVTSIGDSAFYSEYSLTSVEIPNSVTTIGNSAFRVCNSLTSVTIGNSVTSIGDYAFRSCSALTSVTIPENVTSMRDGVFSLCNNLTTINFNAINCDFILDQYLVFPNTITTVNIGESVQKIPDYFIQGTSVTSIEIPNSVTTIGNDAFSNCSSLTSLTIGNSVTSIGIGAFNGCSSLTSVTIPENVTSMRDGVFMNCSNLTTINFNAINCDFILEQYLVFPNTIITVNIGGSVQKIPNYFIQNTSVTSIDIPNSVTSIGGYSFYGCSNLTSLTIGNSVSSIGEYAFYNCSSLTSVDVPNNVTSIKEGTFAGCSGLTSVDIPNSVTSIGNYAFYDCSDLTSIDIPNNVSSIGNYAFSGCSRLTSVEIPDRVSSIKEGTFSGCSRLTSVDIPNSVTSIRLHAFSGCSRLTSVEIPNRVSSIGDSAFYSCSRLTTLTIGENVSSIGRGAFNGCSSLQNVTCLAINPPALGDNAAFPYPNIATLTVPCGSLEAYSATTSFWYMFFADRIEEDCTGLEDLNAVEISFFPNPTNSKVTFNQAIERIELMDLTGKTLRTYENESEINIEQLPAGVYYLRLTNNEKQTLRKLIKE